MDTQWQQCLSSLRSYRLPGPDDMALELRRAHRESRARERCRVHIACYALLGIVLLAWVSGARDWLLGEVSSNPVWGTLTLVGVISAFVAGAMQYRPPSQEAIEAPVRWRYAPADPGSFHDIEPLLEGSGEVRDIVASWLRVMPTLRNAEVERLRAAMTVWATNRYLGKGAAFPEHRTKAAHGL